MKLSTGAIREFQEAYYKDFGMQINENEAEELGTRLIRFMAVVCGPKPKESPKNNL